MKAETRQCQNCKKSFDIEPEDFLFKEDASWGKGYKLWLKKEEYI